MAAPKRRRRQVDEDEVVTAAEAEAEMMAEIEAEERNRAKAEAAAMEGKEFVTCFVSKKEVVLDETVEVEYAAGRKERVHRSFVHFDN